PVRSPPTSASPWRSSRHGCPRPRRRRCLSGRSGTWQTPSSCGFSRRWCGAAGRGSSGKSRSSITRWWTRSSTACTRASRCSRSRTELAISDGAHQGGTPGFFFLPPLVAQPGTGGAFDPDIAALSPQVAICDITLGPDRDCGGATRAIVVYTTTTTPAITVVPSAETYQVNWDTKLEGLITAHTYRVHVAAGKSGTRRELGFADVWLTPTPRQVKCLATG